MFSVRALVERLFERNKVPWNLKVLAKYFQAFNLRIGL